MAKVSAGFIVGILTFCLVIFHINICEANPTDENEKNPILDNKNQYQSVQTTGLSSPAQQQQQNVNATTDISSSAVVPPQISSTSQPLLGVNGTGQRKDMSQTPQAIAPTTLQPEVAKNDEGVDPKKNANQFPKKVLGATAPTTKTSAALGAAPGATVATKIEETEEEKLIDAIDVPENETLNALKQQNLTVNQTTDHHQFYNSTIYVDKEKVDKTWNQLKNMTPNWMLSQSHRRAMTVVLSFNFPFYGHPVRNVTVATGGFIYTGDYVHSWLAATQYIAPLMANFDTSLSNDSFVRLHDTGSSFTVIWENVSLQDKQDVGKFTFSTTLYKNGDIEFNYFSVPILVNAIQDDKHPVKVGLSDAYIIDKMVYFARRKTIYEYHRVNFANAEITNSTIIYLKALNTCLQYTDCASCINHDTNFTCYWCPTLQRCSTGTDRKKHEWNSSGCERFQIPNAASCPAVTTSATPTVKPTTIPNANANNNHKDDDTHHKDDDTHPFKPYNPTGLETASTISPLNGASSEGDNVAQMKSMVGEPAPTRKMGLTLGLFIPICLVSCILLWVLYAYRNPHTKSGQLLIQYRPSQWSWRRGEARYTAATIHM